MKENSLIKSLLWGIGILLLAFFMMATVLLYKYSEVNLDMNQLLDVADFQNYLISDDGTLTSENIDPIIIIPMQTIKNVKAINIDITEMSENTHHGQIFFANASLWQEKGFTFKQGMNNIFIPSPLCMEDLDYVRLDICEVADVSLVIDSVILNSKEVLLKHSFRSSTICAFITFLLALGIYSVSNKRQKIFIATYVYSIYIVFSLKVIPSIDGNYFLEIFICLLSFFIAKDAYGAFAYYKQHNKRKFSWIMYIVSGFIISFSLVGNDFFYNESIGYFETSARHIIKYFLVYIYSLILCITVCYWVAYKNIKNDHVSKNVGRNVFLIFLTSGLIYLVAYNPANMFPDTYVQLRQVFGVEHFSDWHPVFHTLILKFFMTIFKTPFVFAFFQIVLFSYVMTNWLVKLNSKGLNKNIIYIFACTFYFNIAYGLLITNIWKDNLYNTCLIWCTYLIYELIDDFEHFNKYKLNYVYFFLSATGIFWCRHNGIIPMISIMVFLTIFFVKSRNKKCFCLVLLFIVMILVKKPLYKMLDVIPNAPGVMFTPLVHDIAAVIVYNDGSTLSDNVMNEMESILTVEQWKSYYDSTNSDPYTYHCDKYMENLNTKSTKEIVIIYLSALKDEPLRIIGARLMSSQVMWSIFKRMGSLDYLYEKNNTIEIEEEFGYTRKENVLTELFNRLYDIFENSKVLNTIFYRTGVWFCVLMVSITSVIIYKSKIKLLLVLIPIISNMISLAVSMTCQNLRYVWALYIVSILFLFVVMIDRASKEEDCA